MGFRIEFNIDLGNSLEKNLLTSIERDGQIIDYDEDQIGEALVCNVAMAFAMNELTLLRGLN